MGVSFFKLGRYKRVFLEMWAQIHIWVTMLKQWAVGSFFLRKYSRRAHKDPQKFFFFIKTSKWVKWWSWWLRMTNAFILCNLLWKVQKSLAANREGSFKYKIDVYFESCCIRLSSCDSRMTINLEFTSRLSKFTIRDLATWKRFDLRSEYILHNINTWDSDSTWPLGQKIQSLKEWYYSVLYSLMWFKYNKRKSSGSYFQNSLSEFIGVCITTR